MYIIITCNFNTKGLCNKNDKTYELLNEIDYVKNELKVATDNNTIVFLRKRLLLAEEKERIKISKKEKDIQIKLGEKEIERIKLSKEETQSKKKYRKDPAEDATKVFLVIIIIVDLISFFSVVVSHYLR